MRGRMDEALLPYWTVWKEYAMILAGTKLLK
jgi:hypothetical protein